MSQFSTIYTQEPTTEVRPIRISNLVPLITETNPEVCFYYFQNNDLNFTTQEEIVSRLIEIHKAYIFKDPNSTNSYLYKSYNKKLGEYNKIISRLPNDAFFFDNLENAKAYLDYLLQRKRVQLENSINSYVSVIQQIDSINLQLPK